ncbi:hybrid sensor histidine kinase/response regulator [Ahniella affigens]|nr:PAS-domain containing protein [Ahniella affigens]
MSVAGQAPMLNAGIVALVGLVWTLVLFAVAVFGERQSQRFQRYWTPIYTLSLAVYCTAWTFYGTVTQAARWQTPLPPTFIGTILVFVLATPLLIRIASLAKAQNSASIADLIASRFGKDSRLAAFITAVVLIGMVPYVALQLKAVAMSFAMLTGGVAQTPAWQDAALWVAVFMALFAMLFGTRRAAATEHNRGLVLAIAFESVFKLAAMLALGLYAGSEWLKLPDPVGLVQWPRLDSSYVTLAALGAVAMFTLPHQFHVGMVELDEPDRLKRARWWFPVYLLLIAAPTLPIAWLGSLRLGGTLPSDLYVLGLPLQDGHHGLAVLAFMGGVSAATGMVILVALTLSIMIANHWIAPLTLRQATQIERDWRPRVLWHRRVAIALVLALAYAYSRAMDAAQALADIGALSFSALALLAPAVIAAVYRPQRSARALRQGLMCGFLVWLWMVLPPVLESAIGSWSESLAFLHPRFWPWIGDWDAITRATVLSQVANIAVLLWRSDRRPREASHAPQQIDSVLLRSLVARFLPPVATAQLFEGAAPIADADRVARIERELAPVIGSASARLLVDAARRATDPERVADFVGETSATLRFNQQLLEAALENMSQGISVVDGALRLVAWNQRYAERFAYPPELLQVGTPIEDLLRHNLATRFADAEALQHEIDKRLMHMRAGTPYVAERRFADGTVIEIRGNPMPGGGFVATFTDVTAFRQNERQLQQAAETLEQRVQERTSELAEASRAAERANQAKTRFLAAVSHDLLQPIHAAHLFTHALAQSDESLKVRDSVAQIDGALTSAESLLAGLLDISRLDAGAMQPKLEAVPLADVLEHLGREFDVLAKERGLRLCWRSSRLWVRTDAQMLRRILQNFLANAIRYTRRGKMLLGVRRQGRFACISVYDTGPGIAEQDRDLIFEEFRRLDRGSQGLGLGLAIARRMADLLSHELVLQSTPGRGSVFSVRVPIATVRTRKPATVTPEREILPATRVLVVDNDRAVLNGMAALLTRWSCTVHLASDAEQAAAILREHEVDLLMLDFHLDDGQNGLALRSRLGPPWSERAAIVITADHSEAVQAAVTEAGCHLLYKPVRPLALKSLMSRLGSAL